MGHVFASVPGRRVKKATMRMRVYRAASGTWEDLGIVSTSGMLWWERIKDWIRRLTLNEKV